MFIFLVFFLSFSRNFAGEREGVLLENSSWMRVGGLLGGLDIEDGDPPCKKSNVSKSVIANLAVRIMYGVISNKPLNQCYLKK